MNEHHDGISDELDPELAGKLLRALLQLAQAVEDFRGNEQERSGIGSFSGWQSRVLLALSEATDGLAHADIVAELEKSFSNVNGPTISQVLTKLSGRKDSRTLKCVEQKGSKYVLLAAGQEVADSIVAIDRAVSVHLLGALSRDRAPTFVDDIENWRKNLDKLRAFVKAGAPTRAGVYDALLGGFFNSAAERSKSQALDDRDSSARSAARTNRTFLVRAVTHLARDEEIDQFVDVGAGLVGTASTLSIAMEHRDKSRVLYLDNDKNVVDRGEIIIQGCKNARFKLGKFEALGEILRKEKESDFLDFAKPIAISLVALLHFVEDDDVIAAVLQKVRKQVEPGSFLVISAACRDPDRMDAQTIRQVDRLVSKYEQDTGFTVKTRTCEEIRQLFEENGWDIEPPGLQFAPAWRREIRHAYIDTLSDTDLLADTPEKSMIFAGVGKRPSSV